MRVLVLGSGVIGTASAYYLARQGFEVVVVDRQDGPAMETSFANAGQVSPGYASPWAAPGIPLKAIKWLLQKHAPLAIKATGDIDQYLWMAQMLRNCTASRYAVNKERMVRLSEYSRDCLDELRLETGIAYEGRSLGTTQLFRTQAQLDNAAKDIAVLQQSGVPYEVLDRAGIARVEPALAAVTEGRPHIDYRQLLVVDRAGATAIHSGRQVLGIWAEARGRDCAAGGNLLANDRVPAAMVAAFETAAGHLGDRLMAALQAGLSVWAVRRWVG